MAYYVPVDQGPDAAQLNSFEPSFGASLRSSVQSTFNENPSTLLWDYGRLRAANSGQKLTRERAQEQIKGAGLSLAVPEDGYTQEALDILIGRQQQAAARQSMDERTPWGWGSLVRGSAQLLTGVADPLNVASAFVPVVREARAASWMARAGEGFAARAGTRAAIGAVEGAAGAAMLEPLVFGLHSAMQDDYDMTDSLVNLAFGTVLGGVLHSGAGMVSDVAQRAATRAARTEIDRIMAETPKTAIEAVDAAGPAAHEAAFRTALADAAQGRAPDVEAVVRTIGQQEREANFKAWFGDSKVVDAEGKPLVLYRGTANEDGGSAPGNLVYLSPEPSFASNYANKPGGVVMPVYARSSDVIDASRGDGLALWKEFQKERGKEWYDDTTGTSRGALPSWQRIHEFQAWLDRRGVKYDGLWLSESNGLPSLAVRDTSQLKSAIGNSGRFDPNSASLTDPLDAVRATAQRQAAPDALAIGSPDASRAADERLALAPKDEAVESATAQMAEATQQYQAIRKNLELGGVPPSRLEAVDNALSAYDEGVKDAKNIGEAIMQYALCGIRQ